MEMTNTISSYVATPYDKLISCAEMHNDDMLADRCTNAECAMAKVLKYGTEHDVAEAMKHYIHFFMSVPQS